MTALPAWLVVRASIQLLTVVTLVFVVSAHVFGPVPGLEGGDRSLASVIWMTGVLVAVGLTLRLGGGFGFLLLAVALFVGRRSLGGTPLHRVRLSSVLDWWDTVQVQDLLRRLAAYCAERAQFLWRRAGQMRPQTVLVPTAVVLTFALWIMPPSRAWSVSGPGSFTHFVAALTRLQAALAGTPYRAGVRPVGWDVLLVQWTTIFHPNPLVLTLIWPPIARIATAFCVMYVAARVAGTPAGGIGAGLVYTVLSTMGIGHVGAGASSALVAPLFAVLSFHYTRLALTAHDGRAAAWVVSGLLALAGIIGLAAFADALLASIATVVGYALVGSGGRRPVWDLTTGIPLAFLPGTLVLIWGVWSGHAVLPFWHGSGGIPPALLILLAVAAVAVWVRLLTTIRLSPTGVSADAAAVAFLSGGAVLLAWTLPVAGDSAFAILVVALAAAVLWRALEDPRRTRMLAQGGVAVCVAVSLFTLWRSTPRPTPPPLSVSATIRAYIRIETSLPRGTWAAVDTSPSPLAAAQGTIYYPSVWVQRASAVPGSSELRYGRSPLKVQRVFLFLRYLGSSTQESYADVQLWNWYRTWIDRGGKRIQYFHSANLTVFELRLQGTPPPIPLL